MSTFRTPVPIKPSPFELTYKKQSMLIGSCFTGNIGEMLQYYKFPTMINPFGVMYNPISVKNELDMLMHKKTFDAKDLHQYNQTWLSFYHGTRFSGDDQTQVLQRINQGIRQASQWLANTSMLIITFGTSRVYELKKDHTIVSNCHKIPSSEFDHYQLKVDDITQNWQPVIKELRAIHPDMQIVFTISPVRHWKDGAVSNQQSKATLILAVQQLLESFPELDYFPSYEIMMDELRDYRFYDEDMIHPGKTAIHYLWEQFSNTYIKKPTRKTMDKMEEIVKASNHSPLKPRSLEHQNFLKKQIEKTRHLMQKYPHINLQPELNHFIQQLEGTQP